MPIFSKRVDLVRLPEVDARDALSRRTARASLSWFPTARAFTITYPWTRRIALHSRCASVIIICSSPPRTRPRYRFQHSGV